MEPVETPHTYDALMQTLTWRRSIRKFTDEPVSDEDLLKIVDAARLAMSGANSQPWEFIIIKDKETMRQLREVYVSDDYQFTYWLEQQRDPEYRHPYFNYPPEEIEEQMTRATGWADAPAMIAICYDPRKQFGSVLSARANLADGSVSVLSCSMGHVSMLTQIAAASLGLSSARIDTNSQDGYRKVLDIPEPVRLYCMVPVGHRAYQPGPPRRFPVEDLVHYEKYDHAKLMKGAEFLEHLKKIRGQGKGSYGKK